MEAALVKIPARKPIEKLPVVRNFRQVIETRDISFMRDELYQFVILNCGFIAHFNLAGFKATYREPKDFAGVFIRHFDQSHSFFCNLSCCDEGIYKDTGYTRAEIKQEFYRIVDAHIDAIVMWAESEQRRERLAALGRLKEEFEGTLKSLSVRCDGCRASYEVKVLEEGNAGSNLGTLHCLFCGRDVSL